MNRLVFGGLLAFILLAIYVGGVWAELLKLMRDCAGDGCSLAAAAPDGSKTAILNTIGAMISAVVIAALSVSDPDQPLLSRQINAATGRRRELAQWFVTLYLLGWLVTGLAALVFACLIYSPPDRFLADIGMAWLGTAIAASYAFFGLRPPVDDDELLTRRPARDVTAELRAQIRAGKIRFDVPELQAELLGTSVDRKLQELVVFLAMSVGTYIKISNILRTAGDSAHVAGRAVDIGNEDVAADLLARVARQDAVDDYHIDEIIFDAAVAGKEDRNIWNFDRGAPHAYAVATLNAHRNHIHFAVA